MKFNILYDDPRPTGGLRNVVKIFALLTLIAALIPLILQLRRGHNHVHRSSAIAHQQELP
jgi:hypothetical protein